MDYHRSESQKDLEEKKVPMVRNIVCNMIFFPYGKKKNLLYLLTFFLPDIKKNSVLPGHSLDKSFTKIVKRDRNSHISITGKLITMTQKHDFIMIQHVIIRYRSFTLI